MLSWLLPETLMRRIRVARARRGMRVRRRGKPAAYPGVFGRIHPADLMLDGRAPETLAVYTRTGAGGYALIEQALAEVSKRPSDVERFLDFGCGYGRVLRVVVRQIPPARVSAFDVDAAASRFCATEFGVRQLAFGRPWDWRGVAFERYDLIWAGSVLTHLAEPPARQVLSLLCSILLPGGLLVATTLGEAALQQIPAGYFGPRLQRQEAGIRGAYARNGYAFVPLEPDELAALPFEFERPEEFGWTWLSERFLGELVAAASDGALRMLRFQRAGWEQVQDVVVLQRRPDLGSLPPPAQRA
jgi:SAM-dependent methyltransferase